MPRLTLLALLLAMASLAHADPLTSKYNDKLTAYAEVTRTAVASPVEVELDDVTPDDCAKAVADARAEGMTNDSLVTVGGEELKLALVPARLCEPFARAVGIAEVAHVVFATQSKNVWITQIEMDASHPENQKMVEKQAKDCYAAAARVDKLKARAVVIATDGLELSLGEAKQKVCDPIAKAAKALAKARDEQFAEIVAPYKKAGITGEKLDVCFERRDLDIRGPGGRVLTLPQIKRASALFVQVGPDADTGGYTIYRYAFKGDKLVSETQKEYPVKPGNAAFR